MSRPDPPAPLRRFAPRFRALALARGLATSRVGVPGLAASGSAPLRAARVACLPLLAAALVAGCDGDKKTIAPPADPNKVPDFSLLDVNPASPTANQSVSPRHLEGKISAWYFGHST